MPGEWELQVRHCPSLAFALSFFAETVPFIAMILQTFGLTMGVVSFPAFALSFPCLSLSLCCRFPCPSLSLRCGFSLPFT